MPRCKECNTKFEAKYFNQKFCLDKDECIKAYAEWRKPKYEAEKKKEKTKKDRIEKEACMKKGEWLELAQKVFNTFIRMRDKDEPCISCGTMKQNLKYDAGHFLPTTYSYLRFNEDNVHKQCSNNCNKNKHGNLAEYRPRLINKIGLKRVEQLEADRLKELFITITEILELIKVYKA